MAAPKFSDDELELLTEEERVGLLEDIDNGEEEAEGDADTASADEDAAAAAAAAKEVAEAAAAAATAAAARPGSETGTVAAVDAAGKVIEHEEAADEDTVVTSVPRIPNWTAPADTADKLAGIDTQIDEITQKFDDGDLTAQEYRQQVRSLEAQRTELNKVQLKAELSRDLAVDTWSNVAVPQFMEKNPQYAEPGTFLYEALDREVRKLQATADNPFDPKILATAHKAIDAQIRKATGQAEPTPTPTPKPNTTPAAKTAAKREIPPTLAHVPAADITDADGDNSKFAWLDRLADQDAEKYENELAKLSEAEREQYLAN